MKAQLLFLFSANTIATSCMYDDGRLYNPFKSGSLFEVNEAERVALNQLFTDVEGIDLRCENINEGKSPCDLYMTEDAHKRFELSQTKDGTLMFSTNDPEIASQLFQNFGQLAFDENATEDTVTRSYSFHEGITVSVSQSGSNFLAYASIKEGVQ